jgi:hypothetical protein
LVLKNFSLEDARLDQAVSSIDLVKHLSIEHAHWVSCSPSVVAFFVSLTENKLKGNPLCAHFVQQLKVSQKIPPTLYLYLKKLDIDPQISNFLLHA